MNSMYGWGGQQRIMPMRPPQLATGSMQPPMGQNMGMRTQIANAMSTPLTAPQVQPNAQPRMTLPRAPGRAMAF